MITFLSSCPRHWQRAVESTQDRDLRIVCGNARGSKPDGSQSLDLQRDALIAASVREDRIHTHQASGNKNEGSRREACLKALQDGDMPAIRKLDRMGRSPHQQVKTVTGLSVRNVGLKVLSGHGGQVDTTTVRGREDEAASAR